MTIDRRGFLRSTSLAALTPFASRLDVSSMLERSQPDPLADLIVINALGFFDDLYGTPAADPSRVMSPGALEAALASGLTALNFTVTSGSDFEAAVRKVAQRDAFIRAHPNRLLKVFTTEDILRAKQEGKVGIIHGFQNAAMVGERTDRVDLFADLGVRVIQLTYNTRNQIGGGATDPDDPGLTPFGHEVVERLNARRVIVDLSHSGRRTCLDAIRTSTAPITISHTGCAALTPHPRNKTDEELRLVAEGGGFVGIYWMMYLVESREATTDDVVRHIEHAIDVCGEDHVGIGTDHGLVELGDMDTVRTYFAGEIRDRAERGIGAPGERADILPFVHGLVGPDQFRNLHAALSRRGHGSSLLGKIFGQNYLRHAREVWGA